MAEEKIFINSYFDIAKLYRYYKRIHSIWLVSQAMEPSGRFDTTVIAGTANKNADNKNVFILSSARFSQYGLIDNINKLKEAVGNHITSKNKIVTKDNWNDFRDYIERQWGRSEKGYGVVWVIEDAKTINTKPKTLVKKSATTKTGTSKAKKPQDERLIWSSMKDPDYFDDTYYYDQLERKIDPGYDAFADENELEYLINEFLLNSGKRKNIVKKHKAGTSKTTLKKTNSQKKKTTKPASAKPKAATGRSRIKTAKRLLDDGKLKPGHITRLGVKRQTKPYAKNAALDGQINAMLPGYRVSRYGNIYYEARANRSDTPRERRDYAYGAVHKRRGTRIVRTRLAIQKDIFSPKASLQIIPSKIVIPTRKEGLKFTPESELKRGKVLSEAAQMEVVKAVVRKYHQAKIEYGFVVDKYGNVLVTAIGNSSRCPAPSGIFYSQHANDRLIQIHTHPGYTPGNNWHGVTSAFSNTDMKYYARNAVPDCCVTGYDGVIHRIKIDHSRLDPTILSKMYKTAREFATQAIRDDPEIKKSKEAVQAFFADETQGSAWKPKMEAMMEKHETLELKKMVQYEVKKYKELCRKYKDGTVIRWIEDHL